MQPRSEPLLWLQCLALGAIPLELLLIRLVLAGADPGPVPGVERFLIWSVGVFAPAVALWRSPADWGSLLLVKQRLVSSSSDKQHRNTGANGALSSRIAVVTAVVTLLPVLWWLDDSAVLASEFSPVSGQSRLVTLLLVSPLLALIVWQVQQLIQAAALLFGSTARVAPADSSFSSDAVTTQRTSLGLKLLNLPALDWSEPATQPVRPKPAADPSKAKIVEESAEAESSIDAEETDSTSDQDADAAMDKQPRKSETDERTKEASTEDESTGYSSENENPEDESSVIELESPEEADNDGSEDDGGDEAGEDGEEAANPAAPPDSTVAAAASVPVEPEQPGEEQESSNLDTEVSQIDSVAGGSTEGHREQSESSGGEESQPDQSSEPPPGSL